MKNVFRTVLYLQSTALLMTAALADPAAAQKAVPFHGTIDTFELIEFTSPTTFISTGHGTGNATRLGKFTSLWVADVDLEAGVATGPAIFTATNGDKLFTTLVGRGGPTDDPDVVFIVEEQTIVGGTGRFAGATGGFVRESLSNLATGYSSGTFSGTIVLAKGK